MVRDEDCLVAVFHIMITTMMEENEKGIIIVIVIMIMTRTRSVNIIPKKSIFKSLNNAYDYDLRRRYFHII